jgi:hypothetical protein
MNERLKVGALVAGAAVCISAAAVLRSSVFGAFVLFAAGIAVICWGGFGATARLGSESEDAGSMPVAVEATLDEPLSRWKWLVKWFLALPHIVVLWFLWFAAFVLTVVAFFAILANERYPRALFETNVGIMRWTWRVGFYAFSVLGTDRYPPFTLADADYPARISVAYPQHLSRGLALVKWWLLAIPHYLIIGIFTQTTATPDGSAGTGVSPHTNFGLGPLLVLIAAIALLFTGRYPRGIFDLVVGLHRWAYRVITYAGLMHDVYPPFRLDQGGAEHEAPATAFASKRPEATTSVSTAPAAGASG